MPYRKLVILVLLTLAPSGLGWRTITHDELLNSPVQAVKITSQPLAQSAQPVSWENVLQNLFSQRPPVSRRPGGGRGPDDVCLLTPQQAVPLWAEQPLLRWQGDRNTVGIRPADSDTILWRGTAPKDNSAMNQLPYTGKALEPGQAYDWVFFFDQTSPSPMSWVTFQVLGGRDRAQVNDALQALDRKLKAQKASPEAIVLQRANFFIQRGLTADVLQEIYSARHPSKELKQVMQDIETKMCAGK